MSENITFRLFIETGLLVLGGVMFFISLVYSIKKNPRWLLFMSIALVSLYILVMGMIVGFEVSSPKLLKNLIIAQSFLGGLAVLFFLAYRMQKDKKD